VLADLERAAADEPSAIFLDDRIRRVDVLLDDLRALRGWRPRALLLAELIFPDATYMRRTYAAGSTAPLPWLYARRLVRGGWAWMRRNPAPTAPR
jgi:hypothetical protein